MQKNSNLIIGRKPLLEAIAAGKPIDKILFQNDIGGELIGDINRAAKLAEIPIQRVPQPKLNTITKSNHQGVIGIGAMVDYYKLQDVIDQLFAQGKTPRFFWADGITDVRNLGAIARTAKCFGIDALILTEKGNAAINEDAVKSSAGAVLQLTIVREKHTKGVLEILKANGIALYASSLQATKQLHEIDFAIPCCVVLGAEDSGISHQVSQAATSTFIIPMPGDFDSLNVSVAAGVIAFSMGAV